MCRLSDPIRQFRALEDATGLRGHAHALGVRARKTLLAAPGAHWSYSSGATSLAPADMTSRYGAHFWLRVVPAESCRSAGTLLQNTFHRAGHEGHLVTLVPSRSVVIVRLGRTRYATGWDHCAFVSDVLAALARRPSR